LDESTKLVSLICWTEFTTAIIFEHVQGPSLKRILMAP
jgi:hypothetical protein